MRTKCASCNCSRAELVPAVPVIGVRAGMGGWEDVRRPAYRGARCIDSVPDNVGSLYSSPSTGLGAPYALSHLIPVKASRVFSVFSVGLSHFVNEKTKV